MNVDEDEAMKEGEGLRGRAFKIVSPPVVGMTLEPYTLGRILYCDESVTSTNKIV